MSASQYSAKHIDVFHRYLARPAHITEFRDDELESLLEDPAFGDEVRRERARRAAPPPPPKVSPATVAPQGSVLKLAAIRKNETLKDFYKRCRFDAVPLYMMKVFVGELRKFVLDMNERNKERNTRIGALESTLTELRAHTATLEAQLDRVQQQHKGGPSLRWRGVHKQGGVYPEAAVVTRSGGLWIATRQTVAQPGQPDSGWHLVVKAGSYSGER